MCLRRVFVGIFNQGWLPSLQVAAALGHHCRLLRGGEELTDAMTEIAVEDELTAIICSIEPWMKMWPGQERTCGIWL